MSHSRTQWYLLVPRKWISAIASCARRLGRNPYEHGWKSASKTGSSTALHAACTTRSSTVGIPRLRSFPPPLGIFTCRTGDGRYSPDFSRSRTWSRNTCTPTRVSGQATTPVFTGVSPSIAVVFLTDTLPPFPMRRAFPGSEYYGGSVPSAPSAGIGPIQRQHSPVERYTGTNTDGSHVHCCSVNGLGIRLYPCGIATATP